MNLKKNIVLIVGGGIALLLIVAVALALVHFRAGFTSVRDELTESTARLNRLYDRNPFPSTQNVLLIESNLVVMSDFYNSLYEEMEKGQVTPENLEPAQFPILFERAISKLIRGAHSAGVSLPAGFAFGFERYALGELPLSQELPRLTLQLKEVSEICGHLYAAKIAELLEIKRPIYESAAQAAQPEPSARDRRRRGQEEETAPQDSRLAGLRVIGDGIATAERYTIRFKASDAALWDVLNALARSPIFVVASSVSVVNEVAGAPQATARRAVAPPLRSTVPGVRTPVGADGAPEQEIPQNREERIVAGREQVLVTMVLDVYRFDAKQQEGAAQ